MHRLFQCRHYSSIKPSVLLLSALSSTFRHQLLTAWSRSLWGWTASCQEGCPPLWPSTLWPTRYSVMTLQYIGAPASLSLWPTVTKMPKMVCWLDASRFSFFLKSENQNQETSCFPPFFHFFSVKTENDKKTICFFDVCRNRNWQLK